jgi:hypothetical protein
VALLLSLIRRVFGPIDYSLISYQTKRVRKAFKVFLFIFFNITPIWAGEVISNVRGKVIINTYGEAYRLNQKLYIYNPQNQRKIGVLQVMQRRRDQEAVACELLSGSAPPGALVEASQRTISTEDSQDIRGHRTRKVDLDRRTRRDPAGTQSTRHAIGFSIMSTSLNVRTSYYNTTMSGTGIGFDYIFQVPLYTQVSLLGDLGYHPVRVNNSSSTGENNYFQVDYLTLTGLFKFVFNPNQKGGWMAAGAGFILPYSKTSNVLDSDSISTNYSINFAVGTDIVSSRNVIGLKLEYALFPAASTSTTSTNFSQMIFGFSYFF